MNQVYKMFSTWVLNHVPWSLAISHHFSQAISKSALECRHIMILAPTTTTVTTTSSSTILLCSSIMCILFSSPTITRQMTVTKDHYCSAFLGLLIINKSLLLFITVHRHRPSLPEPAKLPRKALWRPFCSVIGALTQSMGPDGSSTKGAIVDEARTPPGFFNHGICPFRGLYHCEIGCHHDC